MTSRLPPEEFDPNLTYPMLIPMGGGHVIRELAGDRLNAALAKGEEIHKGLEQAMLDTMNIGPGMHKVWFDESLKLQARTIPPSEYLQGPVPPQDVLDAAEKVGRWFAEHNIHDWELGPCRARYPKG